MKIGIAQINTTVGDISGNFDKIISNIIKAKAKNTDFLIFPELTLTGYPPRDLLVKKSFVKKNIEVLHKLVNFTENIALIVGFVDEKNGELFNAAAFIQNKKIVEIYHKIHLPN